MIEYAWHDFVGNVGVVLVLVSYFGIQSGRMLPSDRRFSLMNGVGAVLIMVSLYFNFNLSSFVIECVWLSISVYGLVRRTYS